MDVRKILKLPVLLCPAPAFASGVDSLAVPDAAAAAVLPDTYGLAVRMAFSLVAVIGLIWAAMHLLKRFSGAGASGTSRTRVRVLERTYLAPKKAIYIVQIGDRALAVGVTEAQMTALAELDPAETLSAYPSAQEGNTPPFAALLQDVRTRLLGGDANGRNAR